jgi:hypothetical protein
MDAVISTSKGTKRTNYNLGNVCRVEVVNGDVPAKMKVEVSFVGGIEETIGGPEAIQFQRAIEAVARPA